MIPTPEQAKQLVEHFGGQSAAARVIGAGKSTIQYWLNPDREKKREEAQRYRTTNPERARESQRRYRRVNSERYRANKRRRYYALVSAGICHKCGDTAVTQTMCWDCADKHKEATQWLR